MLIFADLVGCLGWFFSI